MLYFNIWTNFWKEWTEIALSGETAEEKPTAHPEIPSPSSDDALSPQEKYQYLTEYGTQILCFLDAKKGCTYLSRNFDGITGQAGATLLGHGFYNLIHGDYRERLQSLIAAPATDKKPQALRCKLLHGDQKYYWYLFQIHHKHEGDEGEFVCILDNINDSMLAQNNLQKAKLEAELALRARSEFLSNMSHELRTPLNAVIGFSQIIESGMFGKIDNPQYMEYIRHIHESGYDLLSKIEDLLEIAAIDAGRVTLTREEVFVSDILRQVRDAQRHHATSAHVTLECEPPQTNVLLYVDRLKLQHVLGHLVANAIRFCPKDGKISLKASLRDNGQLWLCVHDTGGGMSASQLAAVSAALQEESCWTVTNDDRTIGLGLALTREFVALHGGQVSVASKEDEGTRVFLTLPKECVRTKPARKTAPVREALN